VDSAQAFDLVSVGRRLKAEFGVDTQPLTPQMERLLKLLDTAERTLTPPAGQPAK
jgi:hypothetical protein